MNHGLDNINFKPKVSIAVRNVRGVINDIHCLAY